MKNCRLLSLRGPGDQGSRKLMGRKEMLMIGGVWGVGVVEFEGLETGQLGDW